MASYLWSEITWAKFTPRMWRRCSEKAPRGRWGGFKYRFLYNEEGGEFGLISGGAHMSVQPDTQTHHSLPRRWRKTVWWTAVLIFATLQRMFPRSRIYRLFMTTACNYSSSATETGRHPCAAMTVVWEVSRRLYIKKGRHIFTALLWLAPEHIVNAFFSVIVDDEVLFFFF